MFADEIDGGLEDAARIEVEENDERFAIGNEVGAERLEVGLRRLDQADESVAVKTIPDARPTIQFFVAISIYFAKPVEAQKVKEPLKGQVVPLHFV